MQWLEDRFRDISHTKHFCDLAVSPWLNPAFLGSEPWTWLLALFLVRLLLAGRRCDWFLRDIVVRWWGLFRIRNMLLSWGSRVCLVVRGISTTASPLWRSVGGCRWFRTWRCQTTGITLQGEKSYDWSARPHFLWKGTYHGMEGMMGLPSFGRTWLRLRYSSGSLSPFLVQKCIDSFLGNMKIVAESLLCVGAQSWHSLYLHQSEKRGRMRACIAAFPACNILLR